MSMKKAGTTVDTSTHTMSRSTKAVNNESNSTRQTRK